MVVGYAAFNTELKISGTSKVTSNWDIRITNVTDGTPAGSAKNTVKPSWTTLTASMEADLYKKGDAMEYDVTIENRGTLDAKLNDILTNTQNSNSEAVIITFSGYTTGEILEHGKSKLVHVKIEYNPNYEGEETSSEVEIEFDYGQNNNEENNPAEQYLLTYDYVTNGGQSVKLDKEYISSGSNVTLDNTAIKEGWTFVGWNTDKDSNIGLKEYQMPKENTTLYAIYSKELKVTYEKEDSIQSIGKNSETCMIYNNETSCEVTLPEINVSDDSATVGWYEGDNKIGNPNEKYIVKNNIALKAKAEFEPIIQSWSSGSSTDFHNSTYKSKIITATFLDNKNVPDNAVASWDVSANKNGSVMAWVIADETDSTKYHLYIGGDDGVIANEDSSHMFSSFPALTEINFGENFDTSSVTDMINMFFNCRNLTTLDLSNFDTSNVTNMNGMFNQCSNLTTLDLSNFDTSNVTNMSSMIRSCNNLTTLDVSSFDTNNVTDMNQMFYGCRSLTTLDLSNFDTSKVRNMSHMFDGCRSLTTLDLSNFDTSKVRNMSHMFNFCSNLTTLDLSDFNTSNVTNMNSMFYSCSGLTKLVLCSFDTTKVTDMNSMFVSTSNLKSIYVGPNWTTENATTSIMFYGSGVSSVTQSNNCEVDSETMSLSISTTSTTNSITVVANANADSGINRYEFSKDGGNSWVNTGTSNTYTFNGLTVGTNYNIQVRVTSNIGKISISSSNVTTKNISLPTFSESDTSNGKNVTIYYPSGCGSTLTCTYQKNNGTVQYVYSTTAVVNFTDSGNVVAQVTDGTNTVSSSYTVTVNKKESINIGGKEIELVNSGDGLYKDEYEEGRYIYKGADPQNYIKLDNGDLWRIMSRESDGTYKIIKYGKTSDGYMPWDSNNINDWTTASLNNYLNSTYYQNLDSKLKNKIVSHSWDIGSISVGNKDLKSQIEEEKSRTWTGKIALFSASDYIKSNSNKVSCNSYDLVNINSATCSSTNWLNLRANFWTISASTNGEHVVHIWYNYLYNNHQFSYSLPYYLNTSYVMPAAYISASTKFEGNGYIGDEYRIVN